MTATQLAIQAAAWVLDHPDAVERARLYDGHRARRRPAYQGAEHAEDHTEADVWLIDQWMNAKENP